MSFLKPHHLCLGFFTLQTLRDRWGGRRKNQAVRKTTILFASDNLGSSATAILSWFILALNSTLDSKYPINLLSLCPFLPHGNSNDGKVHFHLTKKFSDFPSDQAELFFFSDIADALVFLHRRNFTNQIKCFHKSKRKMFLQKLTVKLLERDTEFIRLSEYMR